MMLEEHASKYDKILRKAMAVRGVRCLEEAP